MKIINTTCKEIVVLQHTGMVNFMFMFISFLNLFEIYNSSINFIC